MIHVKPEQVEAFKAATLENAPQQLASQALPASM